MTLLVMLLVLLTGAALQALLPGWTWLGGAQPPILLALVLFYAFAHSRGWMLFCALLAGLLQDALGQVPLGFSCFCFGLAGFAALRYRDDVEEGAWLAQMVFGGLAAAAVNLLLYILLRHADAVVVSSALALRKTIGSALLGALLTPLVFRVVISLERQLGERPASREEAG
ncbi:MAG: rod shape-determining protein MreD [Verrucomicrobia bacterium]|nr:MAG: rod shape-determining protein MreD [Verrucomicrobiota bacterium]